MYMAWPRLQVQVLRGSTDEQYGTFQPLSGQTTCSDCPSNLGTHTENCTSESECSRPSPGFRILASRMIAACPAGTSSTGDTGECVPCSGNTIAPYPGSTCEPCPGTQTTEDHITCIPRASGSFKRDADRRRQPGGYSLFCPRGTKACFPAKGTPVRPSATIGTGPKKGLICVDVATNVESCGGCPYGYEGRDGLQGGEDCTELMGGTADVSCVSGKCRWRCPAGWREDSAGERCVKTRSHLYRR